MSNRIGGERLASSVREDKTVHLAQFQTRVHRRDGIGVERYHSFDAVVCSLVPLGSVVRHIARKRDVVPAR